MSKNNSIPKKNLNIPRKNFKGTEKFEYSKKTKTP